MNTKLTLDYVRQRLYEAIKKETGRGTVVGTTFMIDGNQIQLTRTNKVYVYFSGKKSTYNPLEFFRMVREQVPQKKGEYWITLNFTHYTRFLKINPENLHDILDV